MKNRWARAEKLLWATPILVGVITVGVMQGPKAVGRAMGLPQLLATADSLELTAIALSSDGSVLAAIGREISPSTPANGTVYLWDARTLKPLKPLPSKQLRIPDATLVGVHGYGLALSPDGTLVGVSNQRNHRYAIYDIELRKELWSAPSDVAAFSPDGRYVALGTGELRDARTGKIAVNWSGRRVTRVHFSPDRKTYAFIGPQKYEHFISVDGTPEPPNGHAIEIHRVRDGKRLRDLENSQESRSSAFSPDGTKIVSVATAPGVTGGVDEGIVRCHSIEGKLLWQRKYPSANLKLVNGSIFCDAVPSPDGTRIAVRGWGPHNLLLLIDAANGQEIKRFEFGPGQLNKHYAPAALAFSTDGKRVFARGKNAVLVWDVG